MGQVRITGVMLTRNRSKNAPDYNGPLIRKWPGKAKRLHWENRLFLQTRYMGKMQIELQNIAARADGLYEYEAGKVLVFIPKEEIKKLSFGLTTPVRLPALSVIAGFLLIAAGVVLGVAPLTKAIISHSNNFPSLKGYALISLNILFGAYFVQLGLRKKRCLILATDNGTKKLVFKAPIAEQKVAEFLNELTIRFEYPI